MLENENHSSNGSLYNEAAYEGDSIFLFGGGRL